MNSIDTTTASDRHITLCEVADYLHNPSLNQDVITFNTENVAGDAPSYPIHIDAVAIVLCVSGKGEIGIDLNTYELGPGSLIVISPHNFVYFPQNDGSLHAHVLMCSKEIMRAVLPKLTEIFPVMHPNRVSPVTTLTEAEADNLIAIYNLIDGQIRGNDTPFRRQKVENLLRFAIYEIMETGLRHSHKSNIKVTRKEEIMTRFMLLVSEHFHTERQVTFYADRLFITPKHLSAVVKKTIGLTAGELIDRYVVLEAKVLLKSTDLTIQEIASRLHFANQSFFGKYFKHLTGYSPSAFRKQ